MPNINLRDARKRDALVRAETVRQTATVRYVDKDGRAAGLRKVLKGTLDNGLDALLAAYGDLDRVAAALVDGDPEVDLERTGMFLKDPTRVYVDDDNRIVYRIVQTEVVRGPDGVERERRPKRRVASNVDGEIPLTWTGRKVRKEEALGRFVFFRKLQIIHVNGLTYDFLYGIAKELAEADSLMLLGAGPSGKEPLIMNSGATPCRGFLEGRVDGDRYVLLLHLSKMELKRPEPIVLATETARTAVAAAAPPATTPEPVPAPQPAPIAADAAAAPKPKVEAVLAALAPVATPDTPAGAELRETVAAAKTNRRRAKADKLAAAVAEPTTAPTAAAAQDAASAGDEAAAAAAGGKKPRAKRAARAKPAAGSAGP